VQIVRACAGLASTCSIELLWAPDMRREPIQLDGSLGWTRTNDQRINSPTLYRLSYQGTEKR
jgi:hypothetical protein